MRKLRLLSILFHLPILMVGTIAEAADDIHCYDSDTFTPLEFTLEDNEVDGPTFKFGDTYSGLVIEKLGLLSATETAWKARDLTIFLPNQPHKSINDSDQLIRHYTHFELIGYATARYTYDGTSVEKEVKFISFESALNVTASRGTFYSLTLNLNHSGKNWAHEKLYYTRSCR